MHRASPPGPIRAGRMLPYRRHATGRHRRAPCDTRDTTGLEPWLPFAISSWGVSTCKHISLSTLLWHERGAWGVPTDASYPGGLPKAAGAEENSQQGRGTAVTAWGQAGMLQEGPIAVMLNAASCARRLAVVSLFTVCLKCIGMIWFPSSFGISPTCLPALFWKEKGNWITGTSAWSKTVQKGTAMQAGK